MTLTNTEQLNVKKNLLTPLECESVAVDVISAYEAELTRISNVKSLEVIIAKTFQWHYETPLYSFFTLQSLKSFSDEVFTNVLIRNFILNLTERVSLKWFNSDLFYNERIVDTYTEAISYNKKRFEENNMSLINVQVQNSLHLTPDTLREFLKDNMWFFIIYIFIVNADRSNVFKILTSKKADTGN